MTQRKPTIALLVALAAMAAGCAEEPAASTNAASDAPEGSPDLRIEEAAAPDADAMPHVHDYWQGRERATLLDESLEITPEGAVTWGLLSTVVLREPFFGAKEVQPPEGALVFEGTGRLEITASWSDPTITTLRFLHKHAGSSDIQPWIDAPNGETVVIEVTPEMTDMPHATVSRWGFLFAAGGAPPVAVGSFRVQMDIVKSRDVATWPAHPDAWGDATELPVLDAEGVATTSLGPTFLLQPDPWRAPEDAVPADAPVPMGTTRLRVVVEVLGVEPDLQLERLDLSVRSAAEIEFDFQHAGEPDASDDKRTFAWDVPVEMEQTDNPYAAKSAWAFLVEPSYATPLGPCGDGCTQSELRFHIRAAAVKEAPVPEAEAA